MNRHRLHLLEKVQVQLATAAAVAVVYFGLWPLVRPEDPAGPMAFLPYGNYAAAGAFAGVVWVLAAACAVVTIHSRPEGALLAALFGAGGICLRSPQARALLWLREDALPMLFVQLSLEVLLLAAVVLGASAIVAVIRRVIAALRPGWLWRSPLDKGSAPGGGGGGPTSPAGLGGVLDRYLRFGRRTDGTDRRALARRKLVRSAGCLLLALSIAIVLVLVLLRSADRGQVLFAMVAGSTVAVFVAHQVAPVPNSTIAWVMPACAAVILYLLAAVSAPRGEPLAWMHVHDYAQALPIDWMTAGAGGGLLGFWMSQRLHEARHMESPTKP